MESKMCFSYLNSRKLLLIWFLLPTDDGISNRSKISILHTIAICIINRRIVFFQSFIKRDKNQFISCETEKWIWFPVLRFLHYFELKHIRRSTQIILLLMRQPARMNRVINESWYIRLVIKATEIMDIFGWLCKNHMTISFTCTSYDGQIKYIIKSQAFPVNSLLNSKVCGRHIKWIFCSRINLLILPLISKCHQFRPSRLSATDIERYAVPMMLNIIWNHHYNHSIFSSCWN